MAFKPKSDKESVAEVAPTPAPVAVQAVAVTTPPAKNAVVELKKESKHSCVSDKEKSDLVELSSFLGQLLRTSNNIEVRVKIKHFQAVAAALAAKE